MNINLSKNILNDIFHYLGDSYIKENDIYKFPLYPDKKNVSKAEYYKVKKLSSIPDPSIDSNFKAIFNNHSKRFENLLNSIYFELNDMKISDLVFINDEYNIIGQSFNLNTLRPDIACKGKITINDKEYGVVVDVNGYGLKGTLCHELMHNTEYRMNTNLYTEWFKKNPKKFEYQYTYVIDANSKYTTIEEDKDNTYFVDSYAKSYPTEDVARIFENICVKEEDSTLLEYPHLYDKALYLKEVMEKEFPSLKEATVFNSLKK